MCHILLKKRVLDAALLSSLLYGCQSWVCGEVKPVTKQFTWALKQLLGVRKSCANDVCLAEAGYPSLPDLIRYKQHKYFHNIWEERRDMDDDPLLFVIDMVKGSNTIVGRLINSYISTPLPQWESLLTTPHNKITTRNSSRYLTYKDINPLFSVHSVYTQRHTVKEHYRRAFTRFRVSGHNLSIEIGRWKRRGRERIPP